MDEYKVNITEPAENDLHDIVHYISSQLNAPIAALHMIQTMKESIAQLKTTAHAYPIVRDDRLASMGYRPLVIKNYIVFYVVNEKEKLIDVDRILYARRDWQNIL